VILVSGRALWRAAAVLAASLAAGSASAATAAPASTRLATDVVPVFESVRLVADARQPGYKGSVRIDLDVRRPAASFALHAADIEVGRVALSGPRGAVEVAHATSPGERLEITASRPLEPGPHVLEIDFANQYDTQATGLYKVAAGGDDYLFTQFEADDARQAFPCFDEPSFKIPFQLTVVVPEAHVAVSNTPIESDTVKDGRRTVVFARTKPLPSYLIALATGPLEFVPIPGMSVPGRVVTVKGASGLAGEAVRSTPRLLAALERYFGRAYPYEKLDLIAVPEFWPGGMENAGAITFRDGILLLDSRGASTAQRQSHVEIVAHELAHMWFGDLVTMAWWDDLWLNESFASWMGDKGAAEAFPEFRTGIAEVAGVQGAMITDARLSTRAIRQPVSSLDNLLQAADNLANQKGQAVLGMAEAWVGEEEFRKGVNAYLSAHQWKNAVAADLWAALGKAGGKDVSGMMATFLDQPGIPLVSIESVEGNKVRVAQRRFLNHGVSAPPATWRIPVGLKYEAGGRTRTRTVLLERASETIELEGPVGWIHPNLDQRGYYRWNVPAGVLQALADGGERTLSARERVGFIGNASALLDAGVLRGDAYLRLLRPFARDAEPEVVSAVVASMQKVKQAFVVPEVESSFAAYLRGVLGPALERIGRERRPGETESVSVLRPQLLLWLGRDGHDPAALAQGAAIARAFLADPQAADPSLVGTALQLAALGGDRVLFDEYRKRIEAAKVPADRQRFLGALGYFRDPALMDEALRYSLTASVRPQELFAVPFGIGSTVAHQARPYQFMVENFDAIRARIPPMFLVFMPHFAGGCSAERAASARAFFADPKHAAPGMEKEIAKMSEAVADCAALRAREGAAVETFLRGL
jgi:alanyl aminopeptidase